MATKAKKKSSVPLLNYKKVGGDITAPTVSAPDVSLDPFESTDTTIKYDPITGKKVTAGTVKAGTVTADTLADRFMTTADYEMVDPSKISAEYGDIARGEAKANSKLSSEIALDQLDTELKGLKTYAPAAAALQRGEIANDNAFNQAQRLAQLEAADPNLQSDLMGQRDRANAFASGRMPSSIDDRALELGVRSKAADYASMGGFGVRSSAARKASELMSAEQRIGLSQYGDQLLTSNIGNRAQLLLAPTEYANAGSQISAVPSVSGSQLAANAQAQLNDKTIISSETALANKTQQEEFKTGLEQDTRKFNTGLAATKDINQAQLNLQAGTTNVGNQLQADTFNVSNQLQADTFNAQTDMRAQEINAANAIDTQKFGIGIKSQESQFKSQLEFNLKNANADRAFQAANVNAGRAMDAMTSNRTTRLQIQQTNSQMIFQEQQQAKAEAAANGRAAMSERGAMARAQMSADLQREQLSANIALQREGMAIQMDQQNKAYEVMKEGVKDSHNSQNSAAVGQTIAQSPSIYKGVAGFVDTVKSIYGSFSESDTTNSDSDFTFRYTPDSGFSSGEYSGFKASDYEYPDIEFANSSS